MRKLEEEKSVMVSVQFMFQYIYWAKYLGGLVFVIWAENCYIIPILLE